MDVPVKRLARSHHLLVADLRREPRSPASLPAHLSIQQTFGLAPGTQNLERDLGWATAPCSVPHPHPTLPFQNKCVPYWPEVGTQRVYGPYSVTNCGEHDTTEYKLRTLHVSPLDNVSGPHSLPCSGSPSRTCSPLWLGRARQVGCSEGAGGTEPVSSAQGDLIREIWHYQYLSWPDHGVPSEPGGVLSFLDQINQRQESLPHAGPIIVHCR